MGSLADMIASFLHIEVAIALVIAFALGYLVRGSGRQKSHGPSHHSQEEIDAALARIPETKWTEINQAIEDRHKLHAIKLLREASGLGLKDSKEAIEAHMQSRFRMRG
ncbi:hypothetical protein HY29_07590 [Hyphomonas beringensis]|uniref:Ribosomal protein L7/L12 C-terminal domain-containing protein n=1 Tax=Hyphomonas beringensis TaxID=1280946 RepID=A0A062UH07_9PROT|nr:hypothetical protein [Hyphomonas beringensis]KCZ56998.1 hypothetical protein HY29_07590 [Hyphomonas beringensis]